MNNKSEATLEISYPKAALVSAIGMAIFIVGIVVIGAPLHDPLFIGFLVFMVVCGTFGFAACLCFMLRCKIGHEGLRPPLPTFYQLVIRWEDIAFVTGFGALFYTIKYKRFGGQCLLPRPFLLKRPDSLREFIELYSPPDNVIRKTLIG